MIWRFHFKEIMLPFSYGMHNFNNKLRLKTKRTYRSHDFTLVKQFEHIVVYLSIVDRNHHLVYNIYPKSSASVTSIIPLSCLWSVLVLARTLFLGGFYYWFICNLKGCLVELKTYYFIIEVNFNLNYSYVLT